MLIILGFAMVATFMTLIMTKRMSAIAALILVPVIFAVISGFGPDISDMTMAGIKKIAPTAVMVLFAILFFGLMIDAGLFDPLIARIVKLVKGDPVKVMMGTAVLALTVGLDGDGTTTYMITASAMLPLYRRLNLDLRMFACVAIMCSAVSNMLPWGGPAARAATALGLEPNGLFLSMLGPVLGTAVWVLFVAYYFGRKERARLAAHGISMDSNLVLADADHESNLQELDHNSDLSARRPRLIWLNLALTVSLLVALITGIFPLAVAFMLAFAIALVINYPSLNEQRERIYAHAGNALAVAGLVFAAGIFTGILDGTGMVTAMSGALTSSIPHEAGPFMAPITSLISIPATFFISNDAFYFGMLPVLSEAAGHYGITPVEMARASLIGQQFHLLSPLVPSTSLLVGMVGIELGDHQRFTFKWAMGSCLVLLVLSLAFLAFPLANF